MKLAMASLLLVASLHADAVLTPEQFMGVVEKVERAYSPRVRQAGGQLVMLPVWEDPAYDRAAAERSGSFWLVRVWAGAQGQAFDSEDGLALTLCHELGHHLGGTPRYPGSWGSIEGQADYFATARCLPQVFAADDNVAIVAGLAVPTEVQTACYRRHATTPAAALCVRSAMAGWEAARFYHRMRGSLGAEPSFLTPSRTRASLTLEQNRDPQCRLDTFFQGALGGNRPTCWFVGR